MPSNHTTAVCESCGATFPALMTDIRRGYARFCSRPCFQQSRGGSGPNPNKPLFWDNVDTSGDCWTWTGKTVSFGYGSYQGKPAHRVAHELTYGPIPEGMSVLHHCDNPPCVRPDHLFLGTQADNMADMKRKGRGKNQKPVGEKNGRALLTASQVQEIRARYVKRKVTQQQLANEYGVSRSALRDALTGVHWKHV